MPSPLAERPLALPHPARLSPSDPSYDAILRAHERAMSEGEPGYLDPKTGLYVMTAAYHAERGTCCGNGCRHCPYVA